MHDYTLAKKYIQKVKNSHDRQLEFKLSLYQYKRLILKKRCYYTGVVLTSGGVDGCATARTLDRIDATKGYVPGNVVACSHAVNQFKACWEGRVKGLTLKDAKKIISKC